MPIFDCLCKLHVLTEVIIINRDNAHLPGGLIRAYGGSASLALDTAPMQIHIPKATIRISTRAANSGAIYTAAAKYNAVTSGETYNDRGELEVTITCDEENSDQLKDAINDSTSGGTQYT